MKNKAMARRWAAATALACTAILAVGAGMTDAAGKGKGSTTGATTDSLSVRLLDPADVAINHGDWVTFDVVSAAAKPYVILQCYRGTELLMSSSKGFFPDYPWNPTYELTSMAWSGGSASCEAVLVAEGKRGTWKSLAVTTFDVAD